MTSEGKHAIQSAAARSYRYSCPDHSHDRSGALTRPSASFIRAALWRKAREWSVSIKL